MPSVTKIRISELIQISWKCTDCCDWVELKEIKITRGQLMFSNSLVRCWRNWKVEKYDAMRPWFSISGSIEPPFSFLMSITMNALIGHLFSGYLNLHSNWWKWTKAQLVVTCVEKQIFKTTLNATEKVYLAKENVKVAFSIRLNYLTYRCCTLLTEWCSHFRLIGVVLFVGAFHFRNI